MASLGRITNSLASAVNENSISLAQLNLDFSLFKVEAPAEYSALGGALSVIKKENAEHGPAHRTARKLGALFKNIIPPVPVLIKSYGTRCTQIMQSPGINPRSDAQRHGPFADYVGADATSIWAAATSGPDSIAVHLLACMLVRNSSDPAKTTSAWVELIAEQKKQLKSLAQGSSFSLPDFAATNAAEQDFSREELQNWDASARSWLRSADIAMRVRHKELELILNHTHLPIAPGATLFTGVTKAWTQAMRGLDLVLAGSPQSITDGAILLAISSWHIYPNLLVCGPTFTKVVNTTDPLTESAGLVTVGISNEQSSNCNSGIYWSLSLSHYRHYGRPVKMETQRDDRLDFKDFQVAVLGSLFRLWKVPRRDPMPASRWILALEDCLRKHDSLEPGTSLHWVQFLGCAARRLVSSQGQDLKTAQLLFDYGYRRGRKFLDPKEGIGCMPWFGLRCPQVINSFAHKSALSGGIEYLRQIAEATELGTDQSMVSVIWTSDPKSGLEHHVYATAIPTNAEESLHLQHRPDTSFLRQAKDDYDEENVGLEDFASRVAGEETDSERNRLKTARKSYRHFRWLGLRTGTEISRPSPLKTSSLTQSTVETPRLITEPFSSATGSVDSETGEISYQLKRFLDDRNSTQRQGPLSSCHVTLKGGLSVYRHPLIFRNTLSSSQSSFQLWVRGIEVGQEKAFAEKYMATTSGAVSALIDLEESIRLLQKISQPALLCKYLDWADVDPGSLEASFLLLMAEERRQCSSLIAALQGLSFADHIYRNFDGATVSSTVFETSLHDTAWAKTTRRSSPTRGDVISCIILLETGTLNIPTRNLESVFGISVGNSIFVFSRLLGDPADEINPTDITRLVGNIGRAGVSLLVPPVARPLIRPLCSSYRAVAYEDFDGKWEDNFKGTSLHLSFTSGSFPIDYRASGNIDHQIFFVESVISVHDGGKWVADLDVLKAFDHNMIHCIHMPKLDGPCSCEHTGGVAVDAIALDTWEEVLDEPPGIGIIRAHGNWSARLAASVILVQSLCEELDPDEVEEKRNIRTKTEAPGQRPSTVQSVVLKGSNSGCARCLVRPVIDFIGGDLGQEFYIII